MADDSSVANALILRIKDLTAEINKYVEDSKGEKRGQRKYVVLVDEEWSSGACLSVLPWHMFTYFILLGAV